MTGGFQGFDLFFVLTNGGPYGATEIPTTLLVKTVFRNARGGLRLRDGGDADRDRGGRGPRLRPARNRRRATGLARAAAVTTEAGA